MWRLLPTQGMKRRAGNDAIPRLMIGGGGGGGRASEGGEAI